MNHRINLLLLILGSVFVQSHIGLADAPENILSPAPGFKPVVTCSDKYAEKVLTIPGQKLPGEPREPAQHEHITLPQRIAARIVANLTGFNFAEEINDDLSLAVSVGSFNFEATLLDSEEAAKNGGSFPFSGRKATFPWTGSVQKPNGDVVVKVLGKVVFSWTQRV